MNKNKNIAFFLIPLCLVSLIALPIETNAKTIKEFEAEVEKFTKELQAKKDKVTKNDAEVAEIRKKIASISKQMEEAEAEIDKLQKEIDESNKEIKKKSEESKNIMKYYQIANGENAYLEYAFGATDITDMIYRMSIVEQLTVYNDKIMKELEDLIKKNTNQQKQLNEKKANLKKLEKSLNEEKAKIDADTAQQKAAMPNLEEQIKAAKANLNYYKQLGCRSTEDIQACQYRIQQSSNSGGGGSVPSTNGFFRPMTNGYITQGYKGRSHMGIDLSSNDKSIAVYPIATGVVFKIYYDNCVSYSNNCPYRCNGRAKVVKIRHNIGGKYIYSTYAHLGSFGNISEGMVVTANTKIGTMGNSGCSTGPHLHLEVTTCDWNKGGGCTWGEYQNRTVNPTQYVNFPSRWSNR